MGPAAANRARVPETHDAPRHTDGGLGGLALAAGHN